MWRSLFRFKSYLIVFFFFLSFYKCIKCCLSLLFHLHRYYLHYLIVFDLLSTIIRQTITYVVLIKTLYMYDRTNLSLPVSHLIPVHPLIQPNIQFPLWRSHGPSQFCGHVVLHNWPYCVGGQPKKYKFNVLSYW